MSREKLITRRVETILPTIYGDFRAIAFENAMNNEIHVALIKGEIEKAVNPVLVRVQTENVTFAMFGVKIGEAESAIQSSLKKISESESGVILYLRQSEHNLDLVHQLETYALMHEKKMSFPEAARETAYGRHRDYGIGAQILQDLGLRKIKLLTNRPPRFNTLEGFDLEIVGTVSL